MAYNSRSNKLSKDFFAFVPNNNSSFRFLTILYYLNDVPRGGETAFPVADEEIFNQRVRNANRKTYRICWNTVFFHVTPFQPAYLSFPCLLFFPLPTILSSGLSCSMTEWLGLAGGENFNPDLFFFCSKAFSRIFFFLFFLEYPIIKLLTKWIKLNLSLRFHVWI